ncbi:hypothetical protein RJT34_33257 [Clitoria ternatea]|uniref:PB1 domain-containing protein n=1 Tax=Clitoria ternatea TaxID=43366 RepID=A0AAN9F1N8_CLITE
MKTVASLFIWIRRIIHGILTWLLRARIFSRFNFTADTDLVLRYTDKDGYLVTIVDDDDLHDMIRRRPKCLRIFVSSSKSNAGSRRSRSSRKSKRNVTLFEYPPVTAPLLGGAVRSLPEPIQEALSKLSLNGASASHVAASLAGMFYKGVRGDGCGVFPPHVLKKGSIKHGMPQLDTQFILDVNVIEGTMMAPSTAFTKIWRMRNNGTLVWPHGTQLVWIGGNMFSYSHSVDLESLLSALSAKYHRFSRMVYLWARKLMKPLTAPPMPGYKFGQRVWVLVQVDASLKDSFYDSSQGLNFNISLDVSGSKGAQVIYINDTLQTHIPTALAEPVKQIVD